MEQTLRPGLVVEYLHSNKINIGAVLTIEKHLTIITPNNRTIKIAKSRFLPWIGPCLNIESPREEILYNIKKLDEKREEIKNEINTEELWELIKDEVEEFDIVWLAELIWQKIDANLIAALGRAVIDDKLHFKFQNSTFKVFPSSVVENKIHQLTKEEKEKELFQKGKEFFSILWQKRQDASIVLPELEPHIEEDLKAILKTGIQSPENKSFQKKWKQIAPDIPDTPHLPLILAQTWGIVPKHYNYLLDQADYKWGNEWSQKYSDHIQKIKQIFINSISNPENIPFVSIDSASTKDIDDAFFIKQIQNNRYKLYLAFAYPVLGWEFENELDKEVSMRASSLYLPEGSTHMLPEELGTDLFSLHAKKEKPALIIEIDITDDGEILNYKLRSSWIMVYQNLTYKEVDEMILKGSEEYLNLAHSIAKKLRNRRIDKGAVIIERTEPIIILTPLGNDYNIELIEPVSYRESQLIVSEFMILANTIIAMWARENNIPLIFRTQDISIPEEARGIWTDPVKIYGIIKLLAATNIETEPKPHASLGVDEYAPMTSPLRRYVDFLNVAQLHRAFANDTYLDKEKLESLIPYLNTRMQEATKIQKYRVRYWKLLYLKRYSKKREWYGIVVDEDEQLVTFILPIEQLIIKVPKNLVRGDIYLGKKFRLWFNKIDPLSNVVKIQKAEEVKWKE